MRIASILVVFVGVALAAYAAFVAGQLVLAGVLLGVLYATGARRPKKKSPAGPKMAAVKRATEEQRTEVPLAAAVLVTLAMAAEKLEIQSRALGHNAMAVYASAAWAYYGSSLGNAESFTDDVKALGLTAVIGTAAFGALTLNPLLALSFGVSLLVAVETFTGLRNAMPAAEAHLVAALCVIVVVDVFTNNSVPAIHRGASNPAPSLKFDASNLTVTSLEYVLGRAFLVAAWMTAALLRRLFAAVPSMAVSLKTLTGVVVVTVAALVNGVHLYAVLFVHADRAPTAGDIAAAFIGTQLPSLGAFRDTAEFLDCSRALFVAAWIVLVPLASVCCLALSERVPKIIRRKYFHFLVVALFLLPNVVDPPFLGLWWSVAIAAAVLVEVARCHGLCGSHFVTEALKRVVDDRDSGIVRTHIYLMVGCALPLLLNHRVMFHLGSKVPWFVVSLRDTLAGLGTLGVMDAVAACIGVKFGKTKLSWLFGRLLPEAWVGDNPAMSHKSFAGTGAGAIAMWLFGFLPLGIVHLLDLGTANAKLDLFSVPWLTFARVALIAVATAVYEGSTEGVDNLELPIFCALVTRLFL